MTGNYSLVSVLGVLLVFTLFHNLVTVSGQNIPAVGLFTFGDSNFDAGNRKFLTTATVPQNCWPYGKSRDDPNGKYSDGKILPDFIVFMISIGMEDYYNFTKNNPNADASAQQAFVISVTNKLKKDICLLYSSGASKFVIPTIAPLGCLPIARQEFKTGNDCYEKLNDLVKQHNTKIGPMLNELAKSTPGFQFTVFDFYNVILRRTQYNMNYRFSVTNISCCGVGTHNAYGCGLPNVHSKLCEYQRSYLYFDSRHNSEKEQEAFAHLLFGADANVVQPMNVRELIVYPVDHEPMREYWENPMEEKLSLVQDVDVDASGSLYLV